MYHFLYNYFFYLFINIRNIYNLFFHLFLEIEIGNKNKNEIFHANHPFLFYIEDESIERIIYIGKIMNPLDTMDNIKIK